jgi:hypothetical protein
VNCFAIAERDNPKSPSAKLVKYSPKPDPIVRLNLDADRILNHLDTELATNIRSLPEDFILEVRSKLKVRHQLVFSGTFVGLTIE